MESEFCPTFRRVRVAEIARPPRVGDEGKPRCQRCIDGGFECQYGTRLSFLQKNAITAQSGEAGSSAAYRRVQVSSFDPLPAQRLTQRLRPRR